MRKFAVLLSAIIITSCSPATESTIKQEQSADSLNEISQWPYFSIKSDLSFKERIERDDGSIALTTYDTRSAKRASNDKALQIYPLSTCPALGVSSPNILGQSNWGRVDFWDTYGSEQGLIELPVCTPPKIMDHHSVPLDTTKNTAYAFCSEKDGKAVVICIQQNTDNPALAEEVFRSFKWTQ